MSPYSSRLPQEVILPQFSLHVYKVGLNPHSFHLILAIAMPKQFKHFGNHLNFICSVSFPRPIFFALTRNITAVQAKDSYFLLTDWLDCPITQWIKNRVSCSLIVDLSKNVAPTKSYHESKARKEARNVVISVFLQWS